MNNFEKNIKSYSEIIVGALCIVVGFSNLISFDTFFNVMFGTASLVVGLFYIFKANNNYNKRKKEGENEL